MTLSTVSRALILLLITSTVACAQEPAELSKYLTNNLYCEKNSDCAIREGACGDMPMNIYFDNQPLIDAAAEVRCLPPVPYTHPRCEKNQCVADKVGSAEEQIPEPAPDPGVACTMEAKLCPDGSAVGREGPNCEFAKCPGE